jgi:hypothetical protein
MSFLAFEAGSVPAGSLHFDSVAAGESPAHRLTLDVQAGDPEIHQAIVHYPEAFQFSGFLTLGPPHTAVGAYDVDLNLDGAPDVSTPLRALSDEAAYVDIVADGKYARGLEPVLRRRAGTDLELTLPLGGDGDATTVAATVPSRVSLRIAAGLLVNPTLGGSYTVACALVTVDPDTGGHDDGAGSPPTIQEFSQAVEISGPSMVSFAHLSVDDFAVRRNGRDRYAFSIDGRFVLGPSSDGLNLRAETVSIALDWIDPDPPRRKFPRPGWPTGQQAPSLTRWFTQTIRGAEFTAFGRGVQFKGTRPGIERFRLLGDGGFHVRAHDVALAGNPGRAAVLTLRIGTDRGSVATHVDEKGHRPW